MVAGQHQTSSGGATPSLAGDVRHYELLKQAVATLRLAPILKLLSILPKAPSPLLEIGGVAHSPSAYAMRKVVDDGMRMAIVVTALNASRTDDERLDAVALQDFNAGETNMMLIGSMDGLSPRLREALGKSGRVDAALASIWADPSRMTARLAYTNILIDKGISLAEESGWCNDNPFSGLYSLSSETLATLQTTWLDAKQTIARMIAAGADINARYAKNKDKLGWLSPLERLLLCIEDIKSSDDQDPLIMEMVSFFVANGARTQNGNTLEFVRSFCPNRAELLCPAITHAVLANELGNIKTEGKAATASDQAPRDEAAATLKKRKITVY